MNDKHTEFTETEYSYWNCATCNCRQSMPTDFMERLRGNHNAFFCYNGHKNYFNKKTDIEEVEGKLMNEYAKNAQLEAQIKELKDEIKIYKSNVFIKLFGK